jgi:glycosyltransferase involved in cell wall biosynthesis
VILTYHNDIVGPGWKKLVTSAYRYSFLHLTLSLANWIVVTTPGRVGLSPLLLRFADKVVHIPVGIDAYRFQPLSLHTDGNIIGFLALLRDTHQQKGLDVLLRAMQILHKRGITVRLKVGGDGNLLPYYRSLAQELGILEKVDFVGFVPEEALVEFYNSLDVFAFPSTDYRFEGFGMAASEALACGRPVVTTTAAGIAPLISENGCGFVITPGDPDALANAIQHLLCDIPLRTEMGCRGRDLAERLSWDKIAEEYEQLYVEALSGLKVERT